MAGHPLLPTIREATSVVQVADLKYTVIVTTHRVAGIDGNVLGIKFKNEQGSMDASIKSNGIDSYAVINALSVRTYQMISPVLNGVAMIGFYLLTDGLEGRGKDAILAKSRLYDMGARKIHKSFIQELPLITKVRLEGAFGWLMSKTDITKSSLMRTLQKELAHRIEVL